MLRIQKRQSAMFRESLKVLHEVNNMCQKNKKFQLLKNGLCGVL